MKETEQNGAVEIVEQPPTLKDLTFMVEKVNMISHIAGLPLLITSLLHLFEFILFAFLAHLNRRLRGELIGWESSRRPLVRACVRGCVNTFKHKYLRDQLADRNQILSEASFG